MTCKGYDPKAVKVPKSVKRMAANYTDNHRRRAFIRSYVLILEDQLRGRSHRNQED